MVRAGLLACGSESDGRPDDPDLCPLPFAALLREVASNRGPLLEALEPDDPSA